MSLLRHTAAPASRYDAGQERLRRAAYQMTDELGFAYAGAVAFSEWTFLSNHGHVLVCLARQPDARLRDISEEVGITERAVQLIINDLQREGYLEKTRLGRRNTYSLNGAHHFRHPLESHLTVRDFIDLIGSEAPR